MPIYRQVHSRRQGARTRQTVAKPSKGMVSMTPSFDRFAFTRVAYVAESQHGLAESAELSVQTSVKANGVTSCLVFSRLSLRPASSELLQPSRRRDLSVCAAPSNRS